MNSQNCQNTRKKSKKAIRKLREEQDKINKLKRYFKRHYKMDLETFFRMEAEQNYCCKICKVSKNLLKGKRLFVDHCHQTGKVRGLLCTWCNFALGHASDNPYLLRAMADYIEQNK